MAQHIPISSEQQRKIIPTKLALKTQEALHSVNSITYYATISYQSQQHQLSDQHTTKLTKLCSKINHLRAQWHL